MMSKLKFLIVALLLTFNFTQVSAQKYAHVNRSEILQNLPEVQKAREDLEKYSKEMQDRVEDLMKEYRTKLKDFEERKNSMSATVRSDKQREIKNLEERIQKFRKEAQKQVKEKEKELLQPIIDRVNNAIEQVAKRKGYVYVFDKSQGSILYAKESRDVTALVKKELNN